MSLTKKLFIVGILVTVALCSTGCGQKQVKRVGMVIGIKPEKIAEYKRKAAPTQQLSVSESRKDAAELQWRFSTPFSTILSRTPLKPS